MELEDKKRDSNFELMRIISMLLIVLGHFLDHGLICDNALGLSKDFYNFIFGLIIIHVNSFILLTGYFGCTSKMKLTKAIKINNMTWFYSTVIMFVFIFIFHTYIPKIEVFRTLLPINLDNYWYINNYLILYLISPLLNIIVNNIDKSHFKKSLVAIFILLCVLPFITNYHFFANNGYTLYNFIFLYLVGAYLRKYPLAKSNLLKKFTVNNKKGIFLSLFIICACFNFLFQFLGIHIMNTSNSLIFEIGKVLSDHFLDYSNPFVIIQSILYFSLFSLFKFKNKFINAVAPYTLGVYLINENPYIKKTMYEALGLARASYIYNMLPYVLLCVISFFAICIIVECIRQYIFKKIYNSKIACKNRTWYRSHIDSLGLHINW